MKKIILSYSTKDTTQKNKLVSEAKSKGIPVEFIELCTSEEKWKKKFNKKIKKCNGLIAIVSDNLNESKEELWKIEQAINKCVPCIGLFCEGDSYSTMDVPDNLYGNMYDWSWDKIIERLRINETIDEEKERILNGMIRSADEFLQISSNNKTYIPNFVNWSFSCELYLKVIDYKRRREYDGTHDLLKLYKNIKNYIDESKLLQIMTSISYNDPNTINRSYDSDDLNKMLIKHRNTFVCWRYIFEGYIEEPYVADATIIVFAQALQIYIKKHLLIERSL